MPRKAKNPGAPRGNPNIRNIGRLPRKDRPLTPTEQTVLAEFLRTGNQQLAGKAAGYSDKTARKNAYAILNRAPVKKLLAETRAAVAEKTKYDAEAAMKEADEAIKFAKETENANAYVKAVELKAKLQGLLVEKVSHLNAPAFSIIRVEGIRRDPPSLPARDVTPNPLRDHMPLVLHPAQAEAFKEAMGGTLPENVVVSEPLVEPTQTDEDFFS